MDRARGRFSRDYSNSPRSEGSGHSNSPRDRGYGYGASGGSRDRSESSSRGYGNNGGGGGGRPSQNPYPGSSRDGGDRPKRSRESPEKSGNLGAAKRVRSDAKFGSANKRTPRYDLDVTLPEGCQKTAHNSEQASGQDIVRLRANYFKLSNKPHFVVYQYHVDIQPEIDSTVQKKGIFYDVTRDIPGGKIFDGNALYLTQKLPEPVVILQGTRRPPPRRPGDAPPPEGTEPVGPTAITLTLKFVREVNSFQDLPLFQLLNTVLRQVLHGLNLQLVGRNFFDPVAKTAIRELRVEVWPGYITSIRQHDSSILLCCDTTSKIMRNENLYVMLQDASRHEDYKAEFARKIIGTTVLTDYNNKTYRIHDIDWDQTPASTFETKNGPKSYIAYYRERYHINIRDHRQPLLLSQSKERQKRSGERELIALIPELCRATGITEDMRSNFQTMRQLGDVTRLDPNKRIERLQQFSRRIRDSEESRNALQKLDMKIDRDLISLEGRIIKKPDIYFDRNGKTRIDRDFGNNLRNNLFRPGALQNWFVIITDNRNGHQAKKFVSDVQRSVRFPIAEPRYVTLHRDSQDELSREIEKIYRADPQLILIVVPNNQAHRYQLIKKKCCIDRAIPTQVVVAKTISRQNVMSIATKVAVQMSCKLGGAPWGIKVPMSGCLIIGYDVSYDTVNKNRTFGSLVAALDQYQSVFYSVASEHDENEQLSRTFTLNVMEAIKQFTQYNGSKPSKIIIYRDGVGDGQIRHVLDHEKRPMEEKLQELGDEIRFVFIIVNKKTNTRFFAEDNRGYRNPVAGTVIDTQITLPERYDFYLVPTSVRQGTVSPTYFNVIADTLGLPVAKLQMLTYFLCFGYYNWTDAIAVPAVCKYASKLAFLCSSHLHNAPNVFQNQKLYFL
ncbi:protein piwi-like [Culicoides brevitarsis]|uniref:protein piwi-like n=1 Tax=Culicoides brevitarsis TaxID=469753 RepID=UPI00307BE4B2